MYWLPIISIFLLYETPFFVAIFLFKTYVVKYTENDGDVRISVPGHSFEVKTLQLVM